MELRDLKSLGLTGLAIAGLSLGVLTCAGKAKADLSNHAVVNASMTQQVGAVPVDPDENPCPPVCW